ncbi:MAG: glutamate synthase [Planctomycetes bacterium]|nr:glutamate synthase [Planctomycetota bacterium]
MPAEFPVERSETAFTDYKLPLSPAQAAVEAGRCLFCHDAPCVTACPTHIDIPQFIRKIANGNDRGAAKTIFESNILGMSCARVCPVEVLCVGACVYNDLDEPPIQIGKLQRHATDRAFDEGWRFFKAGAPTGRRVALVGGGPASLAAAHELRRLGHACTIFERRDFLGGLNTTGIAPHKLKADRSVTEAAWVLEIGGVELRTGAEIGRDVSLADLERDFDAVFVGIGLGADSRAKVPGEDLPGVLGAVDWIERMKLGDAGLAGVRRAVVVGAGNTAMDAARELLALGVPQVTTLYRGTEDAMGGYAHEWRAARVAGVRAEWRAVTTAFEGAGRLERLRCVRVDEARTPVAGSQFTLEADLALLAIGQSRLGAVLAGLKGITVESGIVRVDAHGFTGRPGWYAGGDCANGGKEVVNAAAEGMAAARAIDRALAAGGGIGRKEVPRG